MAKIFKQVLKDRKFKKIQKVFLEFLKYTKGHADTTCYYADLYSCGARKVE